MGDPSESDLVEEDPVFLAAGEALEEVASGGYDADILGTGSDDVRLRSTAPGRRGHMLARVIEAYPWIGGVGHNHPAQNSFVLYGGGKELAMDPHGDFRLSGGTGYMLNGASLEYGDLQITLPEPHITLKEDAICSRSNQFHLQQQRRWE